MIIEGVHRTRYTYSERVFIEPHTIRLRPRSDPRQAVRSFDLRIEPGPDGVTEGIDVFGNDVMWSWFSGEHEALDITTRFSVETLRNNPFDFVIPSVEASALPPTFSGSEDEGLAPYLQVHTDEAVNAFAAEVAVSSDRRLLPFLQELTTRIHESCERIFRPDGDPFPAHVTLAERRGSCRDLAVLYVDVCRAVGVPARFVSGYASIDATGERELHAWAGVFIPGAGWRGYDPTLGLVVSDRHVTLAAAATAAGAAPVDGTFRGSAVSDLSSTIELHTSDAPSEEPV